MAREASASSSSKAIDISKHCIFAPWKSEPFSEDDKSYVYYDLEDLVNSSGIKPSKGEGVSRADEQLACQCAAAIGYGMHIYTDIDKEVSWAER